MITANKAKLFTIYSFIMLISVAFLFHTIILLSSSCIYQEQNILSEIQTKLQFRRNDTQHIIIELRKSGNYYKESVDFEEGTPVMQDVEYYQNISECNCYRKHMFPPSGEDMVNMDTGSFERLNSSCSDEGTFYRPNQNVVAFSFYLDNSSVHHKEKYLEGLIQNLDMMRKFYPGYSLRLYTNLPLSADYCSLVCSNEDLFWCNVHFTPSHGDLSEMVFRTWRFLPLGDPTVDVFLPRDLDSLISFREAAVLEDWMDKGDKSIYVMRDKNKSHDAAILAGMWGASNSKLGVDVAQKLREGIISFSITQVSHMYKSSDQEALRLIIFYARRKDIAAYDSYSCVKWAKFTEVRAFPTERENPTVDFVGNVINFKEGGGMTRNSYNAVECPVECRPEYGKDWIYC